MPTNITPLNQNSHSSVSVQGLKEINSTLQPMEQKTVQKQMLKNTVSNQKDVTIDLSQFLEPYEGKKFFDNINDNGDNI